jgi:hypothetical protein
MINTQELRIGSYILVDNTIRKVCGIKNDESVSSTSYIGFENNNSCEYEAAISDRLTAVPISNELLTELGFTFESYHKTWQHKKPANTVTIELSTEYTALDFSHRTLVKHVQYLHLLQNLFYSVQQQELSFKL